MSKNNNLENFNEVQSNERGIPPAINEMDAFAIWEAENEGGKEALGALNRIRKEAPYVKYPRQNEHNHGENSDDFELSDLSDNELMLKLKSLKQKLSVVKEKLESDEEMLDLEEIKEFFNKTRRSIISGDFDHIPPKTSPRTANDLEIAIKNFEDEARKRGLEYDIS